MKATKYIIDKQIQLAGRQVLIGRRQTLHNHGRNDFWLKQDPGHQNEKRWQHAPNRYEIAVIPGQRVQCTGLARAANQYKRTAASQKERSHRN